MVLVKLPGHTKGSLEMFVNLKSGKRYFFTGDLTWQAEAFIIPSEKHVIPRKKVDGDREKVKESIVMVHHLKKKKNQIIIVQDGKIKEISATPEEMADFLKYFDRVFVFGLDDGEIESLSLIKSGKLKDTLFCSSDGPAIQALAMIGHSDAGISMETLLKKTGTCKNELREYK